MKYQVIMEQGEYALVLRGSRMEEYAVVNGLNKESGSWAWTCAYWNFGDYSNCSQAQALFYAVDYFRIRTEENYISYERMSELATLFKDGLIEDDYAEAMEYMDFTCDMEKYEFDFFGIECNEED